MIPEINFNACQLRTRAPSERGMVCEMRKDRRTQPSNRVQPISVLHASQLTARLPPAVLPLALGPQLLLLGPRHAVDDAAHQRGLVRRRAQQVDRRWFGEERLEQVRRRDGLSCGVLGCKGKV